MNPNTLAIEFSRLLREYLSTTQLSLVVLRNRDESHPGICHSHDFIDANEVMLEAWMNLGGTEFNALEDQGSAATWGEAWDIAKQSEFKP